MVAKDSQGCTPRLWEVGLLKALGLALRGRGFCAPNPAVGAVLYQGDQLVGQGYHEGPGKPHAEVMAIRDAGDAAKGALMVVTLEPCTHHGRTPPCVDAILQAGIRQVVYAHRDPNPQVRAQDATSFLKAAGVDCVCHPMPVIESFYAAYDHWTHTGQPLLTVKLALSQDGKVSGESREPVRITGAKANRLTHQCRYHADCILTSSKTIIADDPQLTARFDATTYAKTLAIVDTHASIPLDARCLAKADQVMLYHVDAPASKLEALKAQGVMCVQLDRAQGGLDLSAVIQDVGQRGFHDVWVEAGPTLVDALLSLDLVSRLIQFTGEKVLGAKAYGRDLAHFDPDAFAGHKTLILECDQASIWWRNNSIGAGVLDWVAQAHSGDVNH